MASETRLSDLLSEFARTLGTDYSIQAILDHLVRRIVGVLPITAAGVTLIDFKEDPRYVAASDGDALRFEKLQSELSEGPCLTAYTSGEAVAIPELDKDVSYPNFAPQAVVAGLRAVFTFPLRQNDRRLGALDLYRNIPGELDERDLQVAQTLADVAAAYLLNAQAHEEARRTSDRYRESALHDALTGLPNRVLLNERLEHAIMRARRSHAPMAVLFADLDRFKQINDQFGHAVGDEVLVAVAGRLNGLLRPGDTLARISGDEFVILCEDLRDANEVEMLATRITGGLEHPFSLSGINLMVSASVGIAFAGRGEDIPSDLMRNADAAMYQAKREGGGRHQIIDLREASDRRERQTLEQDLRHSLDGGQLGLAYHPIVRTSDGHLLGAEALLRWERPGVGVVPPSVVIPLAESAGLIGELGRLVLRQACSDYGQWPEAGRTDALGLAVNVSAPQLMERGFCNLLEDLLDETGMMPAALTLEVTESLFLADAERARMVLSDLRDLGVRLALDDFGTGYSSLSYLKRLRVDVIKIDQGFVADLEHDRTSAAIVSAVVDLSRQLDLTVIAEGIETPSQREKVATLGCEGAQGFFFAKPMSQRQFVALLARGGDSARLPLAG